uniref:Elongator complex protein 1 n=1 Tax=Diabrotica virgifera virgifera TaxID=50390 RepID=A0A6P7GHW4_DIAVI
MNNLEELQCHLVGFENSENQIAFDYSDGLICSIEKNRLIIYGNNKSTENRSIHTINVPGTLQYVKFLSMYDIVFLATETDLILYEVLNKKILFTLSVDSPILNLAWNPLATLLVVIHENYDVTSYVYTKQFIELRDKSSLNAAVPIPVLSGWGSINTQFQGPKKVKKPTETKEEATEVVPDTSPKICLRGNGELFVVNYYLENQRFLKVFQSDLEALNQSEPYTNLQDSVAFMGQGQCIACWAVKRSKEVQLVIFEKNCKVKAEFDMPEIQGSIKKILYHPQMNMLAILYDDKENNNFINIYLYSNGRWFFKQQLYYPSDEKVYSFQWLNLQENLFTTCKLVVFTTKNIECHYFRFIISRCPNTATVAVINGNEINFSFFDKKIIPPPLSSCSFTHDKPVNRILFHPLKRMCVLIDSFYNVKLLNIGNDAIEEITSLNDYKFGASNQLLSFMWEDNEATMILKTKNSIDTITKTHNEMSLILETKNSSPFISIPYNDTQLVLPMKTLDVTNNYIYLTKHIIQDNGEELSFEFALSENREFYVNDTLVCSGVTSLYVFRGYLIFTHSNSKLYCIRLRDHFTYTNDIDLNKIFNREIEQGGVIVACTNLISPQIILQMPRGNIETIACKMITVDVIEEMLKENKWEEVLHILRIEKVNWNVLLDLNPERFHTHIEDFVKSAKNNTILSNIVTEFTLDDNCFETFYKNYSPFISPKFDYDKKSIIIDILNYLVSTDCINNLQSIVAIQQKHISLKSALKSVKDVFLSDKLRNESVCGKAIKQLLIQEHFKDIENVAYNLYDLDFLSLVYRNSLEDPKVYEPEIKQFRNMSVLERKFKMSIRGRNLGAAIRYLLRWETAEEDFIQDFIIKNHLEDKAYFSIDMSNRHFVLVSRLYAKTLSILKKYGEAGILLKKAKLYKEALLEYKKGLDWREVIALCSKLQYGPEEKVEVIEELIYDLIKEKRIDDAVILLESHNNNYKGAIGVLVQHNVFRRAICLAETYREHNLIENEIIPKLLEYMVFLMEKIDNHRKQFETYSNRLDVVRAERISKLHMASLGVYDDQDDLYSDTSSHVASSYSKATSRSRGSTLSSRNRRKEERKKIDLKEGGYYEDIALIRALHILYSEVFNFGEEIKEICLAGYEHNLELANNLHRNLSALQDSMIARISKIWSEVFIREEESSDYSILAIIQNKQDLDPEYRTSPSISSAKSWRLKIFP